jgi:hypothetical protein
MDEAVKKTKTNIEKYEKYWKLPHYRPGEALYFLGVWASQNYKTIKVVGLAALRTGGLNLQRNIRGTHFCCGPGSVVGIATGYWLDGPGIKSRWG